MDWFLYDNDPRHERVKKKLNFQPLTEVHKIRSDIQSKKYWINNSDDFNF